MVLLLVQLVPASALAGPLPTRAPAPVAERMAGQAGAARNGLAEAAGQVQLPRKDAAGRLAGGPGQAAQNDAPSIAEVRSAVIPSDQAGVAFSANPWGQQNQALTLQALQRLAQAKITWVRAFPNWGRVEPLPGRYDWSASDQLVSVARTNGLKVLGFLGFSTHWNTTAPASVTNRGDRELFPPADLAAWERYVETIVRRYAADVEYWEVWNEPDLAGFWAGTPAQYARLLAIAAKAAKRANPNAKIVLGGLALGGARLDPNFLADILSDPANPAAQSFDVMNLHVYGTVGEAQRRMSYVKRELARFGVSNRPIWVTEVGYSSDPALQNEGRYQGERGQAAWLRTMLPHLLDLGATRVFWYSAYDSPTDASKARRHGLLDTTMRPKASYHTYQELIRR